MRRWFYSLSCLTFLLLAGCSNFSSKPDPSRFFTLSSLIEQAQAANGTTDELISLGIGPVNFPAYLDRQEIVTRSADNRFALSENDRWAEPLDENFTRVLSQDLAVLLPTDRILRYPWPNGKAPKYQVAIEVIRFEANSSRDAQLWARWEIIDGSSRMALVLKESRLTRHAKDGTTDSSVAALSEAGADLSREIAAAIRNGSNDKPLMSGGTAGH